MKEKENQVYAWDYRQNISFGISVKDSIGRLKDEIGEDIDHAFLMLAKEPDDYFIRLLVCKGEKKAREEVFDVGEDNQQFEKMSGKFYTSDEIVTMIKKEFEKALEKNLNVYEASF